MTPVGVFLIYPNEDKCHFVNTPNLRQVFHSPAASNALRIIAVIMFICFGVAF